MAAATPVLLVSTATRWYGTARTPRALAKAGFEVTLLTPRNSLAESSRFVTRVAYLPDQATPLDWIHAVAATVRAVSPRQVMPCDDVSFRLLAMLALSPPPQMQPRLQAELAELVRASLGDPAHFAASVDKTLIYAAAGPAGVRVPEHAVISSVDEAMRFADRHGFPLVIKRPYTTAGDGVRIVENAAALGDAVTSLSAPKMDDLEPDASRRLVVQKYVAGTICYQNVAAWQGRYLAGYAGDRLETHGGPMTPGTVVRYHDAPALREFSVQLVEALGMTGLFTSEYIVEKGHWVAVPDRDQSADQSRYALRRGDERRPLRRAACSDARRGLAVAQSPRFRRRADLRPVSGRVAAQSAKPVAAPSSGGRSLGRSRAAGRDARVA
jgi:hypothetical protein